jgi:AcrR family transcriptional regulator
MTPDEVAESQRQRILDAFADACFEHGYGQATVAEVISRAGVSRATFYEQFSDKEECLHAALEQILAELSRAVDRVAVDRRSWPEVVADRIVAALEIMARKPGFANLVVVESHAGSPEARAQRTACTERTASALDRCRDDPRARAAPPPTSAARAAIGGAAAVIADELVVRRGHGLPRLVPDLIFFALTPYLGQAAALAEAHAAVARSG